MIISEHITAFDVPSLIVEFNRTTGFGGHQ